MAAGRKALAVPAAQHHASEIITASSNSSPFGASFGGVAGRIPSLASRPYVEQQRQRPPVVLCPARQSWGAEQDRLRARPKDEQEGEWPRSKLLRMDLPFRRAMERAVKRGLERPPDGAAPEQAA